MHALCFISFVTKQSAENYFEIDLKVNFGFASQRKSNPGSQELFFFF